MEEPMNTQRIPQTDSIQELAKFWDTHDLTEFESELVEVTEPVFVQPQTITLHLQTNEVEAVREIAKSKGVADSELIRQWVLEKLQTS